MRRLAVLIVMAVPMLAQYPGTQYPGQYPGGTYPGGGYPGRYPGVGGNQIPGIPRRGKKTDPAKKTDAQPTQEIKGILRRVDSSTVVLTTDDNRTVTVQRTEKTRFLRSGADASPSDWKAGDRIRIQATQDEEGYFCAVNVVFDREGSERERAAAAEPVEESVNATRQERPKQRRSGGDSDSDDERPVQRRAGSEQSKAQEAPAPPAQTAAAAPQEEPETELRRGPLKPLEEKPMGDDDPGRPRTKRGRPEPHTTARAGAAHDPEVAEATPAAQPKLPPFRTVEERAASGNVSDALKEDPRITKARDVVTNYINSLPNYYCRQQTTRYQSDSRPVNWRAIDVVSAALVYEKGKEHYTNIQVNGKAVKKSMKELDGSWSTGEFASVLLDLFHPSTAADFRLLRSTSINGRDAVMFAFDVDQPNSHWNVNVPSQVFNPAYKGSLWLDRETNQVLRVEMQARNVPKQFPLDTIEMAVDLGFIRIGEQNYFLPTHSEVLSCIRGSSTCTRNEIDFRNYHHFAGESTIMYTDSTIDYSK